MDPDRRDEIPLGPDLTALERRLSGWRPAAGALDRDRMLYDAGRAAAEGRRHPWRSTAAAVLLLAILGQAALLARLNASLNRAQALLAQERDRCHRLETALAARAGAPLPTALAPASPDDAIEPPAPNSYLVLTARMAAGVDDLSLRVGTAPAPPRSTPDPAAGDPHPAPLRPTDIRRVLDL